MQAANYWYFLWNWWMEWQTKFIPNQPTETIKTSFEYFYSSWAETLIACLKLWNENISNSSLQKEQKHISVEDVWTAKWEDKHPSVQKHVSVVYLLMLTDEACEKLSLKLVLGCKRSSTVLTTIPRCVIKHLLNYRPVLSARLTPAMLTKVINYLIIAN